MTSTSLTKMATITHNNCQVRIHFMTENSGVHPDILSIPDIIPDFTGDESLKAEALYDYVNDLHEKQQMAAGMSEISPLEFILYQQEPFRIIQRLESLKWIDIMYRFPRSGFVTLYRATAYYYRPYRSPLEPRDTYAYEMSHQHMRSTHEVVLGVASDETLPLPPVLVDICLQYLNIPPTGRQLVFYNRFFDPDNPLFGILR
jgi:hypothetical protein